MGGRDNVQVDHEEVALLVVHPLAALVQALVTSLVWDYSAQHLEELVDLWAQGL